MSGIAYMTFRDRGVAIHYPAGLRSLAGPLLGGVEETALPSMLDLSIAEDGPEQFILSMNGTPQASGGLGPVLFEAITAAQRTLLDAAPKEALLLHAAALAQGGNGILIAGDTRSGKSTLAAALAGQGFSYLSDEIVTLSPDLAIEGMARPLTIRNDVWNAVSALPWVTQAVYVSQGRRLVQAPTAPAPEPATLGLIIVPERVSGKTPRLERVPAAKAATLLMARNHGSARGVDHSFTTILSVVSKVPVVRLHYDDIAQLEGLEPFIAKILSGGTAMLPAVVDEANAMFAAKPPPVASPAVPVATPKKGPVKLTIGMATYDDYDGVYFTVQALRMYHPAVLRDTEFLVVDNHPEGIAAPALKDLDAHIPNYRYLPLPGRNGTSHTRDLIFREAQGEYVLVLDCHVLLHPGAIDRLLAYFEAHPKCDDLIQGPLVYDGLDHVSSHWDPVWREGMFGTWAKDPRADVLDGEPFDIPLQGLGLFACRREAWLGFNPRFRGFGGEEGYIHEKFRHYGRRALCLPGLKWLHRFGRPGGTPYVNKWEDRIFNYVAGRVELGRPFDDVEEHFTQLLGEGPAARIFADVRRELGLADAPRELAAVG